MLATGLSQDKRLQLPISQASSASGATALPPHPLLFPTFSAAGSPAASSSGATSTPSSFLSTEASHKQMLLHRENDELRQSLLETSSQLQQLQSQVAWQSQLLTLLLKKQVDEGGEQVAPTAAGNAFPSSSSFYTFGSGLYPSPSQLTASSPQDTKAAKRQNKEDPGNSKEGQQPLLPSVDWMLSRGASLASSSAGGLVMPVPVAANAASTSVASALSSNPLSAPFLWQVPPSSWAQFPSFGSSAASSSLTPALSPPCSSSSSPRSSFVSSASASPNSSALEEEDDYDPAALRTMLALASSKNKRPRPHTAASAPSSPMKRNSEDDDEDDDEASPKKRLRSLSAAAAVVAASASSSSSSLAQTTNSEKKSSSSISSSSNNAKKKKDQNQVALLQAQYKVSKFPDRQTRHRLAEACGLTPRCVQIWFQNQRAKEKRKRKKNHSRVSVAHLVNPTTTASATTNPNIAQQQKQPHQKEPQRAGTTTSAATGWMLPVPPANFWSTAATAMRSQFPSQQQRGPRYPEESALPENVKREVINVVS
ncbi:hypothetical protein QOT17_021600 [Balamuthia mandrillaris]